MNIKFLGAKVSNLSLVVNEAVDEDVEDDFKLSFENAYTEEDEKSFIVSFTATISSKDEGYIINIVYVGIFETSDKITTKFKESHFPSVNAPAIAYPFMRSFINTLTVNSGLNPVILPTINFQELVRRQSEGSQSTAS